MVSATTLAHPNIAFIQYNRMQPTILTVPLALTAFTRKPTDRQKNTQLVVTNTATA